MENPFVTFVPLDVCKRIVNIPKVVDRIQEVFAWQAEGQVVYSDPVAMRLSSEDIPFKSHSKSVILPNLSVAGVRVVGYSIQADGSGPSSSSSTRLVILIDLATGSPLAIVDEHYNYTLRTATSVAVAAKHLHPPKPVLGLIGAGGVGHAVAEVFAEVLPLGGIYVTSRRESSRQSLVDSLQPDIGVPITPVDSVEEVLARCNVVVTATTAKDPLIQQSQVRPGTLLCALGSFELTDEVYAKADKVLVDDWAQTKAAHDMKPIIQSGAFTRDQLYAELGEVVANQKPGRERDDEVIVVRTEGMASQDVALAHWVYEEATRRGLVGPAAASS